MTRAGMRQTVGAMVPGNDSIMTRARWLLLLLVSLGLLGAFLFLVVDDYPLRTVIAAR